jgi:hypothetical protein
MTGDSENNAQSYQHAPVPELILEVFEPNGSGNIVEVAAVNHEGAYEAGSKLQQEVLAALSIMQYDPEAKAEIDSLIERNYFFGLDEYRGGIDSGAMGLLPFISVVYDYMPEMLLTNAEGQTTASSHVYIGRHEIRHANQPEEFNGQNVLNYGPLDNIRLTVWSESDAQAEAVMMVYKFDNDALIDEMSASSYTYRQATIQAQEYDDSSLFHFSSEKYDANMRAAAFNGWSNPDTARGREALENYVDGSLEMYENTLTELKDIGSTLSRSLNAIKDKLPEMTDEYRQQALDFLKKINRDSEEMLGFTCTEIPFSVIPQELDQKDFQKFGDRKFGVNYFEYTADKYGEDYKLLAEGSREQLEERLGVKIDQDRLDNLIELRSDVVLQLQANAELMKSVVKALGGGEPEVAQEASASPVAPSMSVNP